MKYLCLIYEDETLRTTRSQRDADVMHQEYVAFTRSYRESGQILGGHALQPTGTATTIRVRDGRTSATDGPFVETREQLGGYYLLDAKDLNEAIQIAAKIPGARTGSIEVRPIKEIPDLAPLSA